MLWRLRQGLGKVKLLIVTKKARSLRFDREIAKNKLLQDAIKQIGAWETMLKYGLINDDNINDLEKVLEKSLKYNVRLIRKKNESYQAEVDYHAIDGLLLQCETQELYSDIQKLIKGINETNSFQATDKGEIVTNGINDDDIEKLRELRKFPNKEAFNEVVEILKRMEKSKFNKSFYNVLLEDNRFSDSDYRVKLVKFYEIYGLDELISTKGDIRKINKGIERDMIRRLANQGDVVYTVRNKFNDQPWVSCQEAKKELREIFDQFNINRTVTGKTIEEYYETEDQWKYKDKVCVRGVKLIRPI